jgi:hypothetical protein
MSCSSSRALYTSVRARTVGRLLAATLLIVVGVSCSADATSPRPGATLELLRNRQRWASAGLHDYEYDFQRICFCLQEATEQVHIVVRRGAVTSVARRSDGQPASTRVSAWPTVDDLFSEVQQRLDQGSERLEVEYDPTYGYPRSIVADIVVRMADDEYSLSAVNLRRLP